MKEDFTKSIIHERPEPEGDCPTYRPKGERELYEVLIPIKKLWEEYNDSYFIHHDNPLISKIFQILDKFAEDRGWK